MDLELRHARVVVSIAGAGSISAAAAELSVPQPSLTAQLRRIERVVGGDLFVRSRTGVLPTPLGERLIPMLVDIVRRSEAVLVEARDGGTPVLRLGALERTPVALRRAVERALPGYDVRTTTVTTDRAASAVEEGSLSAVLMPRSEAGAATSLTSLTTVTSAVTITSEPVWLAVPEGHPLSAQPAVSADDLEVVRWVLRSEDHWFHPLEAWSLRRLGVRRPSVLHRAGGQAEVLEWVAEAGAAALVGALASAPGVVVVPVEPATSVDLVVLDRDDAPAAAVREQLVEGLRDHYVRSARAQPLYWAWLRRHAADHPELAGRLSG